MSVRPWPSVAVRIRPYVSSVSDNRSSHHLLIANLGGIVHEVHDNLCVQNERDRISNRRGGGQPDDTLVAFSGLSVKTLLNAEVLSRQVGR